MIKKLFAIIIEFHIGFLITVNFFISYNQDISIYLDYFNLQLFKENINNRIFYLIIRVYFFFNSSHSSIFSPITLKQASLFKFRLINWIDKKQTFYNHFEDENICKILISY